MSLEQAKKFIERLKTDEAFKAKIMVVEDVAERLKIAETEGYDFTEEEVKAAATELSKVDLGSIEGGQAPCPLLLCTTRCVARLGGRY